MHTSRHLRAFPGCTTRIPINIPDAPSPDDGRCGDGHVGGDGQRVARRRAHGRSRDGGPRSGRAVGVEQVRGREDLPVQVVDTASAQRALTFQGSDAVSKCTDESYCGMRRHLWSAPSTQSKTTGPWSIVTMMRQGRLEASDLNDGYQL